MSEPIVLLSLSQVREESMRAAVAAFDVRMERLEVVVERVVNRVLTAREEQDASRRAMDRAQIVNAVYEQVSALEAFDAVVSATEADRKLGLRGGTVKGWADAGLIPSAKRTSGGQCRVSLVAVRQYAAGRQAALPTAKRQVKRLAKAMATPPQTPPIEVA
jgi:hypothetical protein